MALPKKKISLEKRNKKKNNNIIKKTKHLLKNLTRCSDELLSSSCLYQFKTNHFYCSSCYILKKN